MSALTSTAKARIPYHALVVDDRLENRESLGSLLVAAGYFTERVGTIADAMKCLHSAQLDIVLTDIRLGSVETGLDLLKQVKSESPTLPVIVYTGFGSVRDAVLATKLGAADYLEWPVDPDFIIAAVRNTIARAIEACSPFQRSAAEARLSASERWALFVLRATDCSEDPRTLSDWARCAGVSYTSLREACYLLRIPPHDARDFARALRVVLRLSTKGGRLTTLLAATDRRSVALFCERTGLSAEQAAHFELDRFLRAQTLIPVDNEGLIAVREALARESLR